MFLTYREQTWVISPPEDSDEPYSDQGSSGLSVTPTRLSKAEPRGERMGWEEVRTEGYNAVTVEDVPVGQNAYVVVVEYQDGDTFGSSGYWACAGVYASQEAAERGREAAEAKRPLGDYTGLRPWDGYFAHVTSVRIDVMTVQP